MRISTTLPQDDLRKVKAAAREAEATGYAVLTTSETFVPRPNNAPPKR